MVIHVHIRSSYFWEQSYSLSIVQAPMVNEHNVRQPMEAIGVMDRVEVVSILQKGHPWQAYQVVDRPYQFG
jgi:hypothetical protein